MNQTKVGVGTLRYMAPEMLQDNLKIYNNKIDIWSLGITLYYLATNKFPYKNNGVMVIVEIEKGKTLKLKQEKFSKCFCTLVNDKCLVTDPKSRKSAQELLCDSFFTNDDDFVWINDDDFKEMNNNSQLTYHNNNKVKHQMANKNRIYTTQNISCPGCKLDEIKCQEYFTGTCAYGHATKFNNTKGPTLFCDFGRKAPKGGCTQSKCNRRHDFDGTNFHGVKCPRECGRGKCFLNKQQKCPYFHDGNIGVNALKKHMHGKSAYGEWKTKQPTSSNPMVNESTDIMCAICKYGPNYKHRYGAKNGSLSQICNYGHKPDKIPPPSTLDLACALKGCFKGNLCGNLYSHPTPNDKQKYYCQFDKRCNYYNYYQYECRNNHKYEWSTDKSPVEYVCQFWSKPGGCGSDANECRMFHPNGKKSKNN
eukprot:538776_1